MKNITSILFLFVLICLAGCVNRIDIPEDEDSMLYINLEMLKNKTEFVAELKTTNNLNGTFPITYPEEAKISVTEIKTGDIDYENEILFEYDPVSKKYVSDEEINVSFLTHGRSYRLEAKIENSNLDDISSTTLVPHPIGIGEYELISEEIFEDAQSNDRFWQGTLGINFLPIKEIAGNYGHLQFKGFKTTKEILPNEEVNYFFGNEKKLFELVDVVVGNSAVTDIVHRDGFFIDLEDLENNYYIEIVLRSPFPITSVNQVTDFLHYNLTSVSKEHFDYHIAYHNIKKSQGNIFEENALYRSNITKGLGLFSSCVEKTEMLELR